MATLLAAAVLSGNAAAQSLQGDVASWKADPHLREFYGLVVQACANGCARADVPALEARSRPVFAAMARGHGMSAAQMQAHLAGLPRQMVQIGRDDPSALKSYETFLVALFGPD